eukprot:6338232-Amphidinium_carterae.1
MAYRHRAQCCYSYRNASALEDVIREIHFAARANTLLQGDSMKMSLKVAESGGALELHLRQHPPAPRGELQGGLDGRV